MEFPNGQFVLPHLQFDHGLEFASFFKREAAAYLMRKIMSGLFETVKELATRQPETSLYMQPTQNAVEPDWREILIQNASVTVLKPVSDKV